MRWHRVPPKPAGRIEKITGRAIAVKPARGPFLGHEGVVVLSILAEASAAPEQSLLPPLRGIRFLQFVTASDFLLEADGGRSFVVRARDVFVRPEWRVRLDLLFWDNLEPVDFLLPEWMLEKLEGTPLEPPAALRYREFGYESGRRFEVRGLSRMEAAPFGLPGSGFRDQALVPTLTGGGGRLELRPAGAPR
ncbi:MAG: hypothetical protein HYY06_32105 [Deltaproteobacteria bacterium]|nr:hypothetical protein [Deltaproteobacteria bacterium]